MTRWYADKAGMDAKTPQLGDMIADRYELIEKLGKGAFGSVYRARQLGIDRMVALKLLMPDAEAVDATAVARFTREAKLSSALEHPNTITIYDYGQWRGVLFLAMEYVRGLSLQQFLRREGALELTRALKITRQILCSLQEAHSRGIVHRDLKPGNIMLFDRVGEQDVVKVLDFGIAKFISNDNDANDPEAARQDLTVSGRIVGTPRYMSPEQVRGIGVCAASDLYGLGLIMYEMVTGEQAVTGDSTISLIALQISPDPAIEPNSDKIPEVLRPLIQKATAKDLSARYSNAQEFVQDLDKVLAALSPASTGGFPAVAPLVSPDMDPSRDLSLDTNFDAPMPGPKGKGVLFGVVGLVLALLIIGGVAFAVINNDAEPEGPTPAQIKLAEARKAKEAKAKKAKLEKARQAQLAKEKLEEAKKEEARLAKIKSEAQAKIHEVEVASSPEGAMVKQGSQELGRTPLKVKVKPGQEVQLDVSQKGFAAKSVTLNDGSASLMVVLDKAAPTKIARNPNRGTGQVKKGGTQAKASPAKPKETKTKPANGTKSKYQAWD